MACHLHKDPTGVHHFLGSTGDQVTVDISSASGLAKLTAARLHGDSINVQNDRSVTFSLAAGPNILFLTVITPDGNDSIQVNEDCGGGASQQLDEYPYDPNDPARAYRIFAL